MTSGHQRAMFTGWKTAALLAAILMLFAVSCGKKGPPKPPVALQPAPASDLRLVRQDSMLVLTWQLPGGWQKDYAQPAGFYVERALTSVKEDCPGCPVRFERVERINFQEGRIKRETWRFFDAVQPDMVQRYRVVSFGEKGALGEPSSAVVFDPGADSDS